MRTADRGCGRRKAWGFGGLEARRLGGLEVRRLWGCRLGGSEALVVGGLEAPSEIHVEAVAGRKIRARNELARWACIRGGSTVTAVCGQHKERKRRTTVTKGQRQQQPKDNHRTTERAPARTTKVQQEDNHRTTRAPAHKQQKDNS
jgi:hypothetical protein